MKLLAYTHKATVRSPPE